MSATILQLRYGAVSGASPHTAAAVPPALRRPSLQSDSPLVGSGPSHRAPVISLPGRRPSFLIPTAGAFSGVIWSAALAALFGAHWWLAVPVVFAAAYGFFLRRAFE